MIKRNQEFRSETRTAMRGGDGEILLNHIWEPGKELRSKIRMFSRITIRPGCSIGTHEHGEEEEIFYVISGKAEYSDNGKTVTLNAGDSSVNGGGESHSIRNAGIEPLELLAVICRF